jgi:uncharacterized NAD(P)/FAD-binding protein YdhS
MGRIAIVGAGFSGTLLALHLMRKCPVGSDIALIERSIGFGCGAAYATPNPSHLLNVPAARMSAFHDKPNDFLDWVKGTAEFERDPSVTDSSFLPRQAFGAYIRSLLDREMKQDTAAGRLILVHGEAVAADQFEHRFHVRLGSGRVVQADVVVLAVGNFPPESLPVEDRSFYDTPLYRPDPWSADAFEDLDPERPVLLIGTGLTMVDALVTLLDQGHRGAVHALSRRGLLPHRHLSTALRAQPRAEPFPTNLAQLTRFLRREAARVAAEGADWRQVVDEVRPFTVDVWTELSMADKARFLRHLRPWWDIHRHRMAGPIADRVTDALARGQLQVHAGRARAFAQHADGAVVTYRPRGRAERLERLSVARVINCSGPGCDYGRVTHPLIRSLLESGSVRADPFNLGLDVTSSCALKDRAGAISGRLFAVGPVTKGAFWEMTAVPDIRSQCERLAERLAGLLKSMPPGISAAELAPVPGRQVAGQGR